MGYIGQAPANKVVKTADIEDNAVTSAKIDTDTIAAGDLAANSVDSSELVDGSIDTSHIGALQVTTAKLAADAIDSTKLADDAVGAEHIADNAVGLAALASGTDGNIISYDASGNPVAIATGTSGHFLKSQGAGSQPVFAAAGGGKVLQVVQGSFRNGQTSTTSSTVVNSGATVAITPSSSDSDILVMFTSIVFNGAETTGAFYDISRAISGGTTTAGIIGAAAGAPTTQGLGGTSSYYNVLSTQYVDSPSTTSEVTYRLMVGRWFGSGTVYTGDNAVNDWCIAIEIDGS